MNKKSMIAFDCGNSSFRVILGIYDNEKLFTQVIDQIPNQMIEVNGYFYWDILYIYKGLVNGLKKAVALTDTIDSIGICTWGVDFAFFTKEGTMLNNPCSYRNPYGEEVLNKIPKDKQKFMFQETGILCDKINSVFLLKALNERQPGIAGAADKILLIPDILNYLFTGNMMNEPSELSTTQLMDARTKSISKTICDMFSINPELFCPIGHHSTVIGNLLPNIREEIGIDYDIPVICVPSHDTAAAVMAVPAEKDESFAFISAGTWALIGTELDEPVITDDALVSGLTNEVGAFDTITLLKNNAGMFILQRLKTEYEEELKHEVEWKEIDPIAEMYNGPVPVFPVNDNRYFNPVSMSGAIWAYLSETSQVHGKKNWATVFRSAEESLACSYAAAVAGIEETCKKQFNTVYIVGGGSKNRFINQLTANYSGKKVLTGGKESTSLGNLLTQLKYFYPMMTRNDLRAVVSRSIETTGYEVQQYDIQSMKNYQKLLVKGVSQK